MNLKSELIFDSTQALLTCQRLGREIPSKTLEKWITDKNPIFQQAAIAACMNREDVPVKVIELGFEQNNPIINKAILDLCRGRKFPYSILKKWMEHGNPIYRQAAMMSCLRVDASEKIIKMGLEDSNLMVTQDAIEAARGRKTLTHFIHRIVMGKKSWFVTHWSKYNMM